MTLVVKDEWVGPEPERAPESPRPKSFHTYLPHRVWQYREVIRHHTLRALLRRIPRHVRRLIVERHFRDYTYRDFP